MSLPQQIRSYLNEHRVAFEPIHHQRDFTAQETAADTHTKGKDFAKTVILSIDDNYCMVVLPAVHRIDMQKVKQALGAKEVDLATEAEIAQVCEGCEVGAMPPLGDMFNLPVYVSHHLAEDDLITFNAGTHEDAVRMSFKEYRKLTQPKIMNLTAN